MRLQINKKNNLTNFFVSIRRYPHSILVCLSAILVIINLILPAFFIGESGKARAQKLPNPAVLAKLPTVVSAPPESFFVANSKFQISSWLPDNFVAKIGVSFGSIFGLFTSEANNSSLIPPPSALIQPSGNSNVSPGFRFGFPTIELIY